MPQLFNGSTSSSSGSFVLAGILATIPLTSQGGIAGETLGLGHAPKGITASGYGSPFQLNPSLYGGNVTSFTQMTPPEESIRRAYEKLYAQQKTLDLDLAKMLQVSMKDLYEE
jgi:hypothetical protein